MASLNEPNVQLQQRIQWLQSGKAEKFQNNPKAC